MRLVTCLTGAFFIYFGGAVTARVLYDRGKIKDNTRTLRVLEIIYTPLDSLYNASPAVERVFDGCVHVFVPEESDKK
jgi:hypothetical protein